MEEFVILGNTPAGVSNDQQGATKKVWYYIVVKLENQEGTMQNYIQIHTNLIPKLSTTFALGWISIWQPAYVKVSMVDESGTDWPLHWNVEL